MSLYLIFIIVGIVALSGCAGESQKNEVKLTAEPEEGGEVIGEGAFEVKEKATVQARPAEGYVFEKWTKNGEEISTDETYEIDVEDGKELVAHFAEYENVIKDRNLNKAIQKELDIEGPIQKEDLKKLTSLSALSAEGNDVKDLSGLEYAENLEYLNLAKNEIEDVDPLKNLSNLKELNLASNNIDITAFNTEDGFKNIRSLCLGNNELSEIEPLSNLKNLEILYIGGNEISEINSLKNLDNLKALALSSNEIEDLSPLEEMDNLEYLYLGRNELEGKDIYPLGELKQLKLLDLTSNEIVDVSGLKTLQNLEMLVLDDNNISDISPLKNLDELKEVGLWNNQIKDITPLRELNNVEVIDLFSNEIDNIQFIRNLAEDLPNLDSLSVKGNPVENSEDFEETLRDLEEKGVDESPSSLMQYQGQVFGREFQEMNIKFFDDYDIGVIRNKIDRELTENWGMIKEKWDNFMEDKYIQHELKRSDFERVIYVNDDKYVSPLSIEFLSEEKRSAFLWEGAIDNHGHARYVLSGYYDLNREEVYFSSLLTGEVLGKKPLWSPSGKHFAYLYSRGPGSGPGGIIVEGIKGESFIIGNVSISKLEKDIEYVEIASFDKMKPMLGDLEWSESGEKLFFTKYPGPATPSEIRKEFGEEGKRGYFNIKGKEIME